MKKLLLILIVLNSFLARAQDTFSSNLPIIIIKTNGQQIADDPKIIASMGIINNPNGKRNNVSDPRNEYEGDIGIEVRGQSSQMFPMKSYSIELRDKNGDNNDKALFGLPKESDWVLYAPYTDKTLMRNFLAYTMSNNLGHWAAHCRYTEVILNGEYVGIYVFMEKIKRGKGRVNIAKIGKEDNSDNALTGGYIFSIDKEANAWYSIHQPPNAPTATIQYSYVYPKPEDITAQQQAYLKSYVDDFENALASSAFQDTARGFRKFADENSFIDFFIVNEVSRNDDGYRLSSYFYKDRSGTTASKIHAGPVWDYDLAFRNADYCQGSSTGGWAYQFNYICPGDYWQIPFWWNRLMEDTSFKSNLLCRWKQLRNSVLSIAHINNQVDSIYTLLGEAQQRHFTKWKVLGKYVWPNPSPIPYTYNEEISTLKQWIANRLVWIDNNLNQTGSCATNPGSYRPGVHVWPNPVLNNLTLSITLNGQQNVQVTIRNATGQKLVSSKGILPQGRIDLHYNTSAWAKGVYHVNVVLEDGSNTSLRLVK